MDDQHQQDQMASAQADHEEPPQVPPVVRPVADETAGPPVVRPADRTPGDQRRDHLKIRQMFDLKQFPEGHTNQARYCRNVREMGREFAVIIMENTPRCADQSAAIRCVREAVKWSEEAILREGLV